MRLGWGEGRIDDAVGSRFEHACVKSKIMPSLVNANCPSKGSAFMRVLSLNPVNGSCDHFVTTPSVQLCHQPEHEDFIGTYLQATLEETCWHSVGVDQQLALIKRPDQTREAR